MSSGRFEEIAKCACCGRLPNTCYFNAAYFPTRPMRWPRRRAAPAKRAVRIARSKQCRTVVVDDFQPAHRFVRPSVRPSVSQSHSTANCFDWEQATVDVTPLLLGRSTLYRLPAPSLAFSSSRCGNGSGTGLSWYESSSRRESICSQQVSQSVSQLVCWSVGPSVGPSVDPSLTTARQAISGRASESENSQKHSLNLALKRSHSGTD